MSRVTAMYDKWREPRCLIEDYQEGGCIKANKDTLDAVSRVTDPVDVVCILGGYRTGKSYLMNSLAGNSCRVAKTGFEMSPTIQAKTKGIWIWCIPHPAVKDRCLALMDTEGLGDPMKGDNDHDVWICVLAVLLSHTLMFNSVGTIDENALQHLDFVTKMAHHVRVKAGESEAVNDTEEEESLLAQLCPSFVWSVRDFMLELDMDGEHVTPDGYLERCLLEKNDGTKNARGYNRIRRGIKRFFPSRRCFLLPIPTGRTDMLTHLERCDEKDLVPAFVQTLRELCSFVHAQTSMRKIGGRALNGSMLSSMAECYVESIRRGDIPCIESVLRTTAERENVRAIEQSLAVYERTMSDRLDASPADSVQEFVAIHDQAEAEALKLFASLVIFDTGSESREQFEKQLSTRREHFRRINEAAAKRKCEAELRSLYAPVNTALQQGKYLKPGGYDEFVEDKKTFRKAYLGPGKGLLGREVLEEFLQSTAATEKFIRAVDEKLTETVQQAEGQRRSNEAQQQSSREIKEALIRTSAQLEQTYHQNQAEQTQVQKLTALVATQRNLIKKLTAQLVAANMPLTPSLLLEIQQSLLEEKD